MSAKTSQLTPKFRHHKPTNQGYVEFNGKRVYLGRYDKPETHEAYHRLVAEWIANGRTLPVKPEEITIAELLLAYYRYAEKYYVRKNKTQTSEVTALKHALRQVRLLYGSTKVVDFGPRALKAVRQQMIDLDWSRGVINSQIGRVKRCFRWGVENELVPPGTYHGLQAVAGLRRFRSDARETAPIKPVPQTHIDLVLARVSRQVAGMIRLQLLTGARSGEIVGLRPIDFDTVGRVWSAKLVDHKTAYCGRDRVLYFGPRAQEIVREFMRDCPLDAYLFRPVAAEEERRAAMHAARTTPLTYGNAPGTNRVRKPKRKPGDRYLIESYRRAISRACQDAGIPTWSPHRLRHNAATLIRREYGLEAAQVILGHATADITQVYAEVNREKAIGVIEKMG